MWKCLDTTLISDSQMFTESLLSQGPRDEEVGQRPHCALWLGTQMQRKSIPLSPGVSVGTSEPLGVLWAPSGNCSAGAQEGSGKRW